MGTWAWVKRGKMHWLRVSDVGDRYPLAVCGTWFDSTSITRTEVDGCPEGDEAAQVCRRCYAKWHR